MAPKVAYRFIEQIYVKMHVNTKHYNYNLNFKPRKKCEEKLNSIPCSVVSHYGPNFISLLVSFVIQLSNILAKATGKKKNSPLPHTAFEITCTQKLIFQSCKMNLWQWNLSLLPASLSWLREATNLSLCLIVSFLQCLRKQGDKMYTMQAPAGCSRRLTLIYW